MPSEVTLLRAIAVKLGGVDVGGSEVPAYKAIVQALGGAPAFSSEVPLLRQIVKLSGGAGNGATEVPLMREWAQAVGVVNPTGSEVPLLRQILEYISIGPRPPVDPLAGIPYLRRWYGGKSLEACGMFLDTACTLPITGTYESVAGLRDMVSGAIVATQSEEQRRPIALQGDDDSWYWEADGFDDYFDPAFSSGEQISYSFIFRSVTPLANSYWSLIDSLNNLGLGSAARWGCFALGSTAWHNDVYPASVRRNAVDLSSPFPMTPMDAWQVATVKTNTPSESKPRGIGQLDKDHYGNFECHFFFLHSPTNTLAQINTVDAYANTIIPA